MANTLNLGNGNWATKEDSLLAYNSENGNFKPLPFDFTRASSATVVNKAGLIETVGSGTPRIDYTDDSKGALLLEPSRTNLYSFSNQFDVFWSKINLSAIPNSVTSLDGNLNGYLLQENTSNASHDIRQNSTVVSGQQYTYSVFVKKSDVGQDRNLSFYIGGTNGSISFNTTNGTFFSVGSVDSYSSEDYGNGWWRLQFTDTSVSTSFNIIAILNNGSTIYQGDGTSGVYIYGAQLEQGSYATSIIPTSGSAVTRVADNCNNSANAQVINSTEGVLYAQISALSNSGNTYRLIGLNNGSGTNTNRIFIGYTNNNSIYAAINDTTIAFTVSSFDVKNFNKVAVVYNGSIAKLFINGSEVGSGITNAPTLSGLSRVDFSGSSTGANEFKGNTKDVRVYNTALTDAELIALTK
mgnify:CR=1 FL=1